MCMCICSKITLTRAQGILSSIPSHSCKNAGRWLTLKPQKKCCNIMAQMLNVLSAKNNRTSHNDGKYQCRQTTANTQTSDGQI